MFTGTASKIIRTKAEPSGSRVRRIQRGHGRAAARTDHVIRIGNKTFVLQWGGGCGTKASLPTASLPAVVRCGSGGGSALLLCTFICGRIILVVAGVVEPLRDRREARSAAIKHIERHSICDALQPAHPEFLIVALRDLVACVHRLHHKRRQRPREVWLWRLIHVFLLY